MLCQKNPHNPPEPPAVWICALGLLALVALAYQPSFGNGFIWDDDQYLYQNPVLSQRDGLRAIWLDPGATPQYYPMVHTSYWLEHQLWGTEPLGYHVTNTVVHALAALLLWTLLHQLKLPGAWLAAALFAVHPVNVESVAWVTERKNVLAALFAFASLNLAWRAATAQVTMPRKCMHWALAFLCFVLALWSKTVACSVPAVLLLLLWWQRNLRLHHLLPLIPFFLIGLALALVTVQLERGHVGAMGDDWAFSLIDRCLIAGRALWFYAGKLLWPWPLVFIYPRWQIDATAWWQYLYPLAYLGLLFAGVLRARNGARGLFTVAALFAGILFPALGFFNVYPMLFSFVADHFQYLATPVLLAALAIGICRTTSDRRITLAISTALLTSCVLMTRSQCPAYKNEKALWTHTLERNPTAWIAHNNLGLLQLHARDMPAAAASFQAALRYRPHHSTAWANLGLAYSALEQPQLAEEAFTRSIEHQPRDADAKNLAANFLAQQKRYDEALALYLAALELKPHDTAITTNLAAMLIDAERWQDAASRLDTVLQKTPTFAPARYHAARAHEQLGQLPRAIQHVQALLQLDPQLQHAIWLCKLLTQAQRFAEAKPLLQRLLQQHRSAELLHLAAQAHARTDLDQAIALWEDALKQTPQDAHILQTFAWFVATHKDATPSQRKRALQCATQALQIQRPTTPQLLSCVAVAHAAVREFNQAELLQARAIAALQPLDRLREPYQQRLRLFRQQQPYLQAAPDGD